MSVLGLDLGRSVAWAVGPATGPVLLGEETLPADLGKLMFRFEGIIRGLIAEHGVTVLCWEQPFIGPQGMAQRVTIAQRLYGQCATLARFVHAHGLRGASYYPVALRKAFVGAGNASPEQILAAVRAAGLNPSSDHQADAYLVWERARADFFPEQQQ